MTRPARFALLGDPVEHSLSPRMHAAGFAALGLDAEYVLQRVPGTDSRDVAAAMRALEGGGGNVTVPHKTAAAAALDEASPMVEATGACNCFWFTGAGRLAGENTDVEGIETVLRERLDGPPASVLILGAGGAAAAAGLATGRLGAGKIIVSNRTAGRAASLAERLRGGGFAAEAGEWPATAEADVVINATSLGLRDDDPLPAEFGEQPPLLVLDLVYGEAGTPWTRHAEANEIEAVDGLEVLLWQGAACYPLWFGLEAPVRAMRGALFG